MEEAFRGIFVLGAAGCDGGCWAPMGEAALFVEAMPSPTACPRPKSQYQSYSPTVLSYCSVPGHARSTREIEGRGEEAVISFRGILSNNSHTATDIGDC